ncbi:MAG: 1-phosphofructokinase family hexose kinase [Candidatus Omnitrophica bacterium]|nr:1-phosphofructokinase family hexose kinase [Candidatus Omnitrophota bacterium]
MGRYVLTVTLNPALDITMTVPGLRSGKISGDVVQTVSAGGKGINVARALHLLGVPVFAAGIAAGETGERLKQLLTRERMPYGLFMTGGLTRINWTIIDPRDKSRIRVLGAGPRLTPKEIRRFEAAYERWLRNSSMVVLAGRNACQAFDGLYARLVGMAKKRNIPVVVDTSGRPFLLALKTGPFMVKPNLEEAAEVYGRRIGSLAQIQKAVKWFHHFGVEIVVLSMGQRGAVGSNGKKIWHIQPPRVPAKNDVGCGDALLAGFIYALRRRDFFRDALRRAVAAGTANAMSPTPGSIRRSDVTGLFRRLSLKCFKCC